MCLRDSLTTFRSCVFPGEPVSVVLEEIIGDILGVDSRIANAADAALNAEPVAVPVEQVGAVVVELSTRLAAVVVDEPDRVVFEQTRVYLSALAGVVAELPVAA